MHNRLENRAARIVYAGITFVAIAMLAACNLLRDNQVITPLLTPTPTSTSVLQPYFDAIATDTAGMAGSECQVNSDCMWPASCVAKQVAPDQTVGACVAPAATPTPLPSR